MKIIKLNAAPFTTFILSVVFLAADGFSHQERDALVRPFEGSRLIVGDGEVPNYILDYFLYMSGDQAADVVLIDLDGEARVTKERCEKRGVGSVSVLSRIPQNTEALTLQLLNVDGVWIEGNPEAIAKHPLLLSLLKNVTKRNGVIALGSSSVSILSELDQNDKDKRLQSPFAKCEFYFGGENSAENADEKDSHLKVHWTIPDSAGLVVHQGRRIVGFGHEDISVLVKEANGWPKREHTLECIDVFGAGECYSYSLDLLSWVRSANERGRPAYPPKEIELPIVENGTLFLHGGSRLHEDVLEEFVRLAGGKDVQFVCIPSAQRFDRFDSPGSYSEGSLRDMGCENVTVVHTDDPFVANESKEIAELIGSAQGVWIDGGRTYRFMDCYEDTQVPQLLADVLKRGGVVGGSSAGCQVPSDFLVRGNPTSNQDIEYGGYTRGMGLLKGVIIDAHFLQRERHEPFLGLMKKHPQFLGIGIDESTALIVQKDQGRVIGKAAVSFYDMKSSANGVFQPVVLKAGESYDLKLRKTAGE